MYKQRTEHTTAVIIACCDLIRVYQVKSKGLSQYLNEGFQTNKSVCSGTFVLHTSVPSEPLSIIQASVNTVQTFLSCLVIDNSVTHILSVTSWETADTALG